MAERLWLTIPEVAEHLCTPIKTIRRWIADGRLRAYRPGKRVLIHRDDVERFVRAAPISAAARREEGGDAA